MLLLELMWLQRVICHAVLKSQNDIYSLNFMIKFTKCESWNCFIIKVANHKAYCDYWMAGMLQCLVKFSSRTNRKQTKGLILRFKIEKSILSSQPYTSQSTQLTLTFVVYPRALIKCHCFGQWFWPLKNISIWNGKMLFRQPKFQCFFNL